MYTAQEISLGWFVAPRIDIADVILLAGLMVGTLPFVLRRREARPWIARLALALALAALWFLPGWEAGLERAGQRTWGPYGDRGSSGLEFFVLLAVASAVIGFCSRCVSGRGPAAFGTVVMVFAAAASEALVPHATLLWAAYAVAPLTLLLILAPSPPEEAPA